MAKEAESLESRVLRFVRARKLISRGEKVVVGVSGGPDSVCLLHILYNLRDELGVSWHVAHLNHQLRGAESDADAEYVAGLSRKLGLPATIERRDVKAYRSKHRLSLEEAAREVRYTFFAEVAASFGIDKVAVGHTQNDHIETILMHLVRGSGTRGLRGLQPVTPWRCDDQSLTIVRPLLEVSREETEGYCRREGLAPRVDASNLLLSQLRNRIRHELLPLLEKYNPRVGEALVRTAGIAADDLAFMDAEAERAWQRVARLEGNAVILDRKGFLRLSVALKRHLLRMAIEKLVGEVKDIEAQHIEQIVGALAKPAGKRIVLPEGITFAIDYDRYLLSTGSGASSPYPPLEGEFTLRVPGATELPRWTVEARVVSRMSEKPESSFVAYLDAEKTGAHLAVRARRRGDRFQPLGMGQPKSLSEFMVDAKIPRAWRDRIPLVCSPAQIVWVVGYRLDDRVRVTEKTKEILRLEVVRSDDQCGEGRGNSRKAQTGTLSPA